MNKESIKKNINQMVIDGEINSIEFDTQLRNYIRHLIIKKYGASKHLLKNISIITSAGVEGFFEGYQKYDLSKGNVCAYTYYFIMHQIHKTYCQLMWNVSIYYAQIREHIIDSVNAYYNHNNVQLLHNTLLNHGVNPKAIRHLVMKNALDSEYASICVKAL